MACDLDNSIYVSKSDHLGGSIPGKIIKWSEHGLFCYISHNKKEVTSYDSDLKCQILISSGLDFTWTPYSEGDPVPANAFVSGKDADNTPLYSFRGLKEGQYHCGYIQDRKPSFPWGGTQWWVNNGHILVNNT